MARGFRGMKQELMEIINYILSLSCFSVSYDVDDLHWPAKETEAAGLVDGEGEQDADDRVLRSVVVRNKHCSDSDKEEDLCSGYHPYLTVKLDKNEDSQFSSTSQEACVSGFANSISHGFQITERKPTRPKAFKSIWSAEVGYMVHNTLECMQATNEESSSSETEDGYYYCSKKKEDDGAQIQKPFTHECEPSVSFSRGKQLKRRSCRSLKGEETRGCHENDESDYVMLQRPQFKDF